MLFQVFATMSKEKVKIVKNVWTIRENTIYYNYSNYYAISKTRLDKS